MKALVDLTTSLGGVSTVTDPTYTEWFKGWIAGTAGAQDVSPVFMELSFLFTFFIIITQLVGLLIALTTRLVPAKNHETTQGREEMEEALMNAFDNSDFSQHPMVSIAPKVWIPVLILSGDWFSTR